MLASKLSYATAVRVLVGRGRSDENFVVQTRWDLTCSSVASLPGMAGDLFLWRMCLVCFFERLLNREPLVDRLPLLR